jgi:hypothetical protein
MRTFPDRGMRKLSGSCQSAKVRHGGVRGWESEVLSAESVAVESLLEAEIKRPLPDSNRGWRICNPLPYRLAKGPSRVILAKPF